jgi:hypothetical protein
MFDDPRTHAAVEVLVERYGFPRYVAAPVVVSAWLRLHVHALGEGDDGRIDHLSYRRFAEIAWPECADAPRRYGRREKCGEMLLEAMSAIPAERDEGLVCYGDPVERPEHPDQPLHGIASKLARQVTPTGFEVLHAKILRDRRRKRDKAKDSSDGRATAPPSRPPGRATGAATHPPSTNRVQKEPPQSPPSGEPPSAAGAAASSSTPGRGSGVGVGGSDRSALLARARDLLLNAEPNLAGQMRGGVDTTLRSGAHYLLQIEARTGDAAHRVRLEGLVGSRDPLPGVLLEAAAPERFSMLERSVAGQLNKIRTSEAGFIRSTLARQWIDQLGRMADDAVAARVAARRSDDGERSNGVRSAADLIGDTLSEGGSP